MLARPPATGAVPSAAPSTEKVTVPVAGTPVEVLSTASTVDPAASGVTVSARVAVAATGAARRRRADDAALGAEAADGAGVLTDCRVPDPLLAGPQATRASESTPAVQ